MQTALWADFAIGGVRYERSSQNRHIRRIASVRVRVDLGNKLSPPSIWTRQQVIDAIKQDDNSFVTAIPKDDRWLRGDDVRVVRINGTDYLRIERSSAPGDDLGSLPEF